MNPHLKFGSQDPLAPPSSHAIFFGLFWVSSNGFHQVSERQCNLAQLCIWLRSESQLEKLVLRQVNPKPCFVTRIFSSQSSFGLGLPLAGAEQNIPVNTQMCDVSGEQYVHSPCLNVLHVYQYEGSIWLWHTVQVISKNPMGNPLVPELHYFLKWVMNFWEKKNPL